MVVMLKINEDKFDICLENQNQIIMEFAPLIKYIAKKVVGKSGYMLELDEMISYGVLGLIDAIEKYDETRENKFKTYAEFRIKGAMLDYLRDQDIVPRSVRDRAKFLERMTRELEEKLGRKPENCELIKRLNVSREKYFQFVNSACTAYSFSIDETAKNNSRRKSAIEFRDESYRSNPINVALLASSKKVVAEAISNLPERERMVISLYYYDDINLREIGEKLGISESRASQLHSQAVIRLKAKLDDVKDELDLAA